ncbi:MAG TPA: CARDB domain-containing protein [Candidatus Deferrimicrobiaceae bacterium]|nr:CARDB domain-containing protein [Candidatus Deferrimicrobiaceae bacterium]
MPIFAVSTVFLILSWGGQAAGGGRFADSASPGGGGTGLNFIVREIRVTPIRAHVGDLIKVEMIVENQGGEGAGTSTERIYANGKSVAQKLFHYDIAGGTFYHETLFWDTKGMAPGEYRIRGEVFLWYDTSPFDNYLDVKRSVELLPPGVAFSGKETGGGYAIERDPRYKPAAGATEGEPPPPGGATGY